MSRRLFGTDGIRGVAGTELSPELAWVLGRATAELLGAEGRDVTLATARDTRESGPALENAFAAGARMSGAQVFSLGVAPTPAVSFTIRSRGLAGGCVVSASHNPASDNGLKLFGPDGRKTPDELEARIERRMESLESEALSDAVSIPADASAVESYVRFLERLLPEGLDGMLIALDAANGAAFEIAPRVLRSLGARLVCAGVSPDGRNINAEGGATKPATIQRLTAESGAQIGIAFDGDADRVVFSDERGRLVNGDRTMGIWASHWRREGVLDPPIVVGTVMSNVGYEKYLQRLGIRLERAPVGDKYVSQAMIQTGARIGGEQSGHVIFAAHGPTGDGIVTALELLRVLRREGRTASSYIEDFEPWPQLLLNVKVASLNGWQDHPEVAAALAEGERELGGCGRLVVRASGTQPMLRIMVEAESAAVRDRVAESVFDAMQRCLGGKIYSKVDLTHALGD